MINRLGRYAFITVMSLLLSVASADEFIDRDHDGVLDKNDKCLNTPPLKKMKKGFKYSSLFSEVEKSETPVSIPVDNTGCALDRDADGVPDYLDYCPDNTAIEISKGVNKNGCSRHSDDDGTPDYRDKCPNTKKGIKTDRFGCPI